MRNRYPLLIFLVSFLFSQAGIANQSLDFVVIGVIASSDDQQGVALMKNKSSGRVSAVREGDQIQDKLSLTKVDRRFVTILWDNQAYRLGVGEDIPQALPKPQMSVPVVATTDLVADLRQTEGIERQGNVLTVSETLKNALIGENLSKVLMQAAAVPHTINGRLAGFQLLDIDEGSIFDVAGFKNGDVITHINEQAINNAALAIRALNSLRQSDQASFVYLRQNKEHELTVRIN